MRIEFDNFMGDKFTEVIMKKFINRSKQRSGMHRSHIISCPQKYINYMNGMEAIYESETIGIFLIGELAHLLLHENFTAQEYEILVADLVSMHIDAVTCIKDFADSSGLEDWKEDKLYPIEAKTCYDAQTEVFTDSGWKYFKDLNEEDLVLSMNPETRDTIFVEPLEIVKNEYHGDLFKYSSESLDIAVTPNHQMLVGKHDGCKQCSHLELIPCSDLIGKDVWLGIPKILHIKVGDNLIEFDREKWVASKQLHDEDSWFNPSKGKLEHYDGMVYCAIVEPYHTLLVRRNNKHFWCGNTRKMYYKKDQLPTEWLEQLSIGMSYLNVNVGYLLIVNVVMPFPLKVVTIHMNNEEIGFYKNLFEAKIKLLDSVQKNGEIENLEVKRVDCEYCEYRPSKRRKTLNENDEGCKFFNPIIKPKKVKKKTKT